MTLKVLVLTRYGPLGASSRLRMLQYLPALAAAGISVDVQSLFDDEAFAWRYAHGGYSLPTLMKSFAQRLIALLARKRFDLIWLEKEALPWVPLWIERLLLKDVPYVLDLDDAVFHQYDNHRFAAVRWLFGQRIDRLMNSAAAVVCGNEYLAQRAQKAGAQQVEVLPTVVDLDRYPLRKISDNSKPRIVWIGTPSSSKYLQLLREPLAHLAAKVPFTFRVIGVKFDCPGVDTEHLPWAQATEVQHLQDCVIGVMPLADGAWERGKCGYKLKQYMACGLPIVASPVGVNRSIVRQYRNGFLASDATDWCNYLGRLLANPGLRQEMGLKGREIIEQHYCLQVTAPRLVRILQEVGSRKSVGLRPERA